MLGDGRETHVEGSELRAVTVEGLVVEVDELLGNGVDVGHSGRVRVYSGLDEGKRTKQGKRWKSYEF
jgi:hypothetical protein